MRAKWVRLAYLARYGNQDVTKLLGRRMTEREELFLYFGLVDIIEHENSKDPQSNE